MHNEHIIAHSMRKHRFYDLASGYHKFPLSDHPSDLQWHQQPALQHCRHVGTFYMRKSVAEIEAAHEAPHQ